MGASPVTFADYLVRGGDLMSNRNRQIRESRLKDGHKLFEAGMTVESLVKRREYHFYIFAGQSQAPGSPSRCRCR